MVAVGPCLLHEITNCSTCTGLDKKLAAEEKASRPVGIVMPARHPGKCPRCGEFFDVGTPITSTTEGWVCCGEAPVVPN